ncbi:MAG: zinc-binding alcohol dehydrogenase family protein [Hyphomicrobiales bacterium]|nr:zinc-binding alcohol dehydrogenase family protein [Hyphomicrobiales bacterium]
MKAIVCTEPGHLEPIERPEPAPISGFVPVDIKAIGICGTDFHIYKGLHPFLQYPRIMGHELSGVVAGEAQSRSLRPGAPVVINPYFACGKCNACRKGKTNCCANLEVLGVHIDGGMCERVLVPEQNLYPAGNLSLRDAAMIEFLAIGAHAVRRSELQSGDRVLVVGAGPIGVGTALFARLAGGAVAIMDVSTDRLAMASDQLGLSQTIEAGDNALMDIDRVTDGESFDVVFDATGNARSMEASFEYVGGGGTIVMVGVLKTTITFDDAEFHRRELTIRATRNATKEDFETVMAAVAAGHIPMDAINTDTAPLAELPEAMPAWLAGDTRPLKAIVTPW